MRNALAIDEMITRHSAIMDKYDPRKRVALIVGEWGAWHDPEPGSRPGFLYQQNTMRDALSLRRRWTSSTNTPTACGWANIAQMVNVLQR
jgi:alpha-N-arabinofuranosidase